MLPNWSLCLHPLLLQYMLYTIALQCFISYRVKAKVLPMVYRVLHDLFVFWLVSYSALPYSLCFITWASLPLLQHSRPLYRGLCTRYALIPLSSL